MKITLTAFFLLFPLLTVAQQKNQQPLYKPPGKLVDIGGYRLHLNCTGKNGPTVVLIPGASDFSFDWGLVQPRVSRFTRVCSYDRAKFAWSDPGPTPRTMLQDAYELHTLLRAAGIKAPYVLVGHSIGGLIARVYAAQYPNEVAGMVLVDPTHEDTTLMYQGKLVRVRNGATGIAIPSPQTLRSSPPKPPAKEDIGQFEFNQKLFGAPKIASPFDKLPAQTQAMRLWFLSQPPRAAAGPDLWAEELQAMYASRSLHQLGSMPLVVLLPKPTYGEPPNGVSVEDWRRINEDKRRQKVELANLSQNSRLIVAEKSGHHIQLDEPHVVMEAVRLAVDSVRHRKRLAP